MQASVFERALIQEHGEQDRSVCRTSTQALKTLRTQARPTHDEIETKPWSEIRALHEEKIPDQLQCLDEHSEFYSEKFAEWNIDPG